MDEFEKQLNDLGTQLLNEMLEDLKKPKFPKVGIGYMYFDSEHALRQKEKFNAKRNNKQNSQ